KFAYLGQYFDKAHKGPNGTRSTTETGILSEYGEFFPTEPGRTILTTKPDPDQNGLQGECTVHVIKLSVDANHDGNMDETFSGSDHTHAGKPYVFWVNNDTDLYSGIDNPGHEENRPKDWADWKQPMIQS